MDAIEKLASIGGPALCGPPVRVRDGSVSMDTLAEAELSRLLTLKNGFYAFESALHVLPSASVEGEYGLDEWNAAETWRTDYEHLADGCFSFSSRRMYSASSFAWSMGQ